MRIAGVNFPEQVLSALRDDRLVIFAGAGVSMGEPANLPSFDALVADIANGTGKGPAEGESLDRFLGRLAVSGVNVHDRAVKTLSRDGLAPTSLHSDLLRCFGDETAIRVVTTNFDLLFEQAADEAMARRPEIYSAPALPRGNDFDGLVHIHGSVVRPRSMVLTDEDFGRAYLTEGWARRFLVDVFQSFTVLFVGYSHKDVVMSYLSRALPTPDPTLIDVPHRFALTDTAGDQRWELLGISPIDYENADGAHTGLVEGVTGLVKYMQRGLLDWQRTIGEIARGLPPDDPEQQDLITDALADPFRVRFFTEAAEHLEWIDWLDGRGHLARMFDASPAGNSEGPHRDLAWWLCTRFSRKPSDPVLRLVAQHGPRMGNELWVALVSELGAKDTEKQETEEWKPDVLAKWISYLLDTIPNSLPNPEFHLESLAEAAARASSDDSLIAVFDAMARLSVGARSASVDRDETLNDVWENHVAPRIHVVAEQLLSVVLARLRDHHRWACVWEGATRECDSANWHRNAIEARNDDSHYYDSNDVLIDAARDCLCYLVENEPLVAGSYLDQMVRANAPLLRRIAVHGVSRRNDLSADENIEWLLARVSLHDRACRRELFRFVELTYRDASDVQRQLVLAAVAHYPNPAQESEHVDE